MVRQVRRSLHHAPDIAREADAPAFAGTGDKIVVPTVITAGTPKAMGEDAAFEVFAKRLADVGTRRMVVALAVELACA